jgi:MFS family permease
MSQKSLKAATNDGIAWALMIGFGEVFLSAYAIYLGASPFQIAVLAGVTASVPAIAQLLGLRLMHFIESRRKLILAASALQAFSLIPIALVALTTGADSASLMIFLASLYFFFGATGVPAWNSLIGDLVPQETRGTYFGGRNKKIALASLLALITAGPILSTFKQISLEAVGFLSIFLIAAVARFISVYWLARYEDPPQPKSENAYFSFYRFISRTAHSNFAKFAWFVCLMLGALFICGPFFSLYLLKELGFSYSQFTFLSACLIVSQFLTLSHWGSLTDRFGNKSILFCASIGISIAPILWTFSTSFYYLIFVHLFSGFVWSGFNLSAANFLFDAVTPAKRARCAAYQSILNGAFSLAGSMLGSFLISHPLPLIKESLPDLGHKADYYLIMYVSAFIRCAVLAFFWAKIREVREVEAISHKDLIFKIINLRALNGSGFSFYSKNKNKSD